MHASWVRSVVVVMMLVSLWSGVGWTQALRVVGFNVESGGARPDVVDDLITVDGVFTWVRPPHLIRTQCSFDSVLDFVFVAGAARQWSAASEILATDESYCPSDRNRSDHRPVLALFQLSDEGQPSSRQLLLVRIQRMEAELIALKALVEQMSQ